ncbi:MAG TPA: CBS domain-containing protein [Acidimicrobiales bacterium]|nr:CBS domain-containing protein [Acidimicrobiales bacterium]
MSPEFLHLSAIIRGPLVDPNGERIGRVDDLIVRLDGKPHPPITGLVARVAGRELFIPIERIGTMRPRLIQLIGATLELGRFERRPGELLLARDLQARHLIHVVGAHLIRANEIELAETEGLWQVVGVDPSGRGVLRRLLPRPLARRIRTKSLVDWGSIEPFVAHVPTARMRIPLRKLSRLRAAQIADLVEAASHDEGEEIIEVVSLDRELEADVFEELDPDHQREFLASRSNVEAARVLATMEPDDAADLINDLDQDRRLAVLEALPPRQQAKVRRLLSYNPETGGGLMNPDFLSLPGTTTVEAALEAIRQSDSAPEALATVYTADPDGRISGTVSVVRLLKASPQARLSSVAERDPVTVRADADIHSIVRKMSDFNLSTAPVVDDEHRMLGVITVDDVLELLLPTGWRRDFGMTAAQE